MMIETRWSNHTVTLGSGNGLPVQPRSADERSRTMPHDDLHRSMGVVCERGLSRRSFLILAAVAVIVPLAVFAWSWWRFPSDRTPEGAYLRVVTAVNRGAPERAFAYLETRAQHACYTIRDMRHRAIDVISAHFPASEQAKASEAYRTLANAPDGADVFAIYARERGWLDRLRRDLSGIARVEANGDRATVLTVRGTRYAFRRRENGIWGLTLFTATLDAEAAKAARDLALIEASAADYQRAQTTKTASPSPAASTKTESQPPDAAAQTP
jgi:hypothetical protein